MEYMNYAVCVRVQEEKKFLCGHVYECGSVYNGMIDVVCETGEMVKCSMDDKDFFFIHNMPIEKYESK